MTEMKPQEGKIIAGPSLRGSMGRSAAGHNGRVAKEKTSAVWQGGWMPENISGVPAGRSVFLLTSPLIGLLDHDSFLALHLSATVPSKVGCSFADKSS